MAALPDSSMRQPKGVKSRICEQAVAKGKAVAQPLTTGRIPADQNPAKGQLR